MLKAYILCVLLCLSIFSAGAAGVITIDSECIKLKDIFPNVKIDEDVFCGLSYGEEKTINHQMSQYIINKYNIAGAIAGTVTFRRNGRLLTENKLRGNITDLLSIMYPDVDVEVGNIRMSREFYYSDAKGYELDIPKGRFGNVSITVDNGGKRQSYTIDLTAYADIYVTKSSIRKGNDISGMVELQRMDLSRVRGESIKKADGLIAVRNISAGRPVTIGDVALKPDALKGAAVQIEFHSGALNVTTAGELEEDAYIGKNVRVKNTASGKIVRGVYTEGRKVLVKN